MQTCNRPREIVYLKKEINIIGKSGRMLAIKKRSTHVSIALKLGNFNALDCLKKQKYY